MVATQGTKQGTKRGPGRPRKAVAKKAATTPKAKHVMTDEHKAALAAGRSHAKIVGRYLEAIGTKKKRGRKVSVEQLAERLAKAEADLKTATGLDRAKLIQFVKDTKVKLAKLQTPEAQVDISVLEKEFISVAKAYGEAQRFDKSTWTACGVEKRVLVAAGI